MADEIYVLKLLARRKGFELTIDYDDYRRIESITADSGRGFGFRFSSRNGERSSSEIVRLMRNQLEG